MWTMIASLASSALSSVSGILVTLGVVLGLVGLGAFEQHKIDANALTSYKAAVAQQHAKDLADAADRQRTIYAAALAASAAETKAQADRAVTLQQELTHVQSHIIVKSITSDCVPLGLLRVLYAGSHGVPADSLALPPGQSDGSCSSVGWTQLAAEVLHNYGRALANAGQLDGLNRLLKQDGIVFKEKK